MKNKAIRSVNAVPRVVVIGAGITGLSAAHRLLELGAEHGFPLEVTVLEGRDRPGGVISTKEFEGFTVEEGPDSFLKSKPEAMALSFITQFAQDADINTQVQNNLSPETQQQIQDQLNTVTTTSVDSQTAAGLALFGGVMLLFYFVILAFFIICSIKIFTKAGRKWWEAIIPIYNVYVLLKIIGRPGWWLLLFFVLQMLLLNNL